MTRSRIDSKAHWSSILTDLGACLEAVEWAKTQKSAAATWRNCERGDWMLWIAGKLCGEIGSVAHRQVVAAAVACVYPALEHVPEDDLLSILLPLHIVEEWCAGRADDEDRDAASDAAPAASAAWAVVSVTWAAWAVASAAALAAARAASDASAASAAWAASLKLSADIVREMIPMPKLKPATGNGRKA